MRKALLITPHFPPDSSAATHRVRLLAPHLAQFGWQPTVLTVDASSYEGQLDPDLLRMVPATLRVVRARALPSRLTRVVGVGDLGLRSLAGLYREAAALLRAEPFDALFITIFPAYTALLGPLLRRRFPIPFVLDYQDPWVGAWGDVVGGGPKGSVDLKSRMSRLLASRLEPYAVRAASAITAVSEGTYLPILKRHPEIHPISATIPIGVEPADFGAQGADSERPSGAADMRKIRLCYAGAMLPLGFETLRALFEGVRRIREQRPDLYARLHLQFVGTSNQTTATSVMRVTPIAQEMGVADVVEEIATRVPYTSVLRLQANATGLLALGSSESHYTASKIYPMLMTRRPVLAIYHEQSSVVSALRRVSRAPSVRVVTYSDEARAESKVDAIFVALLEMIDRPVWRDEDVNHSALSEFFAITLAGRLADVFDRAVAAQSRQAA